MIEADNPYMRRNKAFAELRGDRSHQARKRAGEVASVPSLESRVAAGRGNTRLRISSSNARRDNSYAAGRSHTITPQ